MEVKKEKLICQMCNKEFSSTSAKNRHVRDFHPEVEQLTRKKRIICPMCPNDQVFSYHINLLKHLTDYHKVQIRESVVYFRNLGEFKAWKALENREVDYSCDVKKKIPTGGEEILYNCNRSDSRGFVSSCTKRSMKVGGSIRIHGMCPSRIKVKIDKDGKVTVKFTETHVGHDDDELRCKRLSKDEEKIIVGQLTAGLSNNRILQDAKKIQNVKLKRINLITKRNLAYLIRKHNIDNKRHEEEGEDLCINETSTSQSYHQNEETLLLTQENSRTQDQKASPSFNETREIGLAEINNFGKALDNREFEKLMAVYMKFKNNILKKRKHDRLPKGQLRSRDTEIKNRTT